MITAVDVDGDIVLMDVQADAFLCIARDRMPDGSVAHREAIDQDAELRVEEHLAAAGFDVARWRWADPDLAHPRCDVRHVDAQGAFPAVVALPRMIVAGLATAMRLRGPIARYRVRRRACRPIDDVSLARLVATFDELRAFVPRLGRCLPHSLCLRDFLGLHGIGADIVFGVRTHPFEAHCWVERDGHVLNDTADHVAWFTPIYAC